MPRTVNGGGDQLARGAVKVQFRPAETTKKKWDKAFDDFDPEKFRRGSTSRKSFRDAGTDSGSDREKTTI